MIVTLNEVGKSPNKKARVRQIERGINKGKWTWEYTDWVGGHFDTESEAAADMKRVRDREGI